MSPEPDPQRAESHVPAAPGLPRGVLILVGLAAGTVAVAGLRSVSGIVGPAFLALVLTIAALPIRTRVTRRGAPAWVGTLLTVLVVYLGLVLLSVTMLVAAARFASLVPSYDDELASLLDGVRTLLADLGVDSAQIQALLGSFDLSRLAGFVTSLLTGVLSLLTNLFFVVTLVLFICLDSSSFGAHLRSVRPARPEFVAAMESFAVGTRTYLLVSTAFGLVVAVIDTALLWVLGVPGAVLWGILAFITNYIPNIGFLIGLVPPAVLALLEGGPGLMVAVVVAYSVINVIIQSVIQPKLVGDAVGLSTSVTFLSLVVWAWILGPVGAVLAIPLTLLAKALLVDVDPRARWIGGLIGDRSPP